MDKTMFAGLPRGAKRYSEAESPAWSKKKKKNSPHNVRGSIGRVQRLGEQSLQSIAVKSNSNIPVELGLCSNPQSALRKQRSLDRRVNKKTREGDRDE